MVNELVTEGCKSANDPDLNWNEDSYGGEPACVHEYADLLLTVVALTQVEEFIIRRTDSFRHVRFVNHEE